MPGPKPDRRADPGLRAAIKAAGGISALAARLGITAPSVWNWVRVPADRVRAVERITGIDRVILRPDIFSRSKSL